MLKVIKNSLIAVYLCIALSLGVVFAASSGTIDFVGELFVPTFDGNNPFVFFPKPDPATGNFYVSNNVNIKASGQEWEGTDFIILLQKDAVNAGNFTALVSFTFENQSALRWQLNRLGGTGGATLPAFPQGNGSRPTAGTLWADTYPASLYGGQGGQAPSIFKGNNSAIVVSASTTIYEGTVLAPTPGNVNVNFAGIQMGSTCTDVMRFNVYYNILESDGTGGWQPYLMYEDEFDLVGTPAIGVIRFIVVLYGSDPSLHSGGQQILPDFVPNKTGTTNAYLAPLKADGAGRDYSALFLPK